MVNFNNKDQLISKTSKANSVFECDSSSGFATKGGVSGTYHRCLKVGGVAQTNPKNLDKQIRGIYNFSKIMEILTCGWVGVLFMISVIFNVHC